MNDIFAGTAAYYARYRLDYPTELYEVARRTFGLDDRARGALLDLGTGTGFVALELARHFERVTALDVDAEMLHWAAKTADARGVTNVEWLLHPAEELAVLDGTPSGGPYRLVTVGSAFHWMDRPRILDLLRRRVEAGGGIFLAGLPGFISSDVTEDDQLAATVTGVVDKYLGEPRRAGSGTFTPPSKRWEAYLADAGYEAIEVGYIPFTVEFQLDSIIGLLYSTSFANRRLLGDRVDAFEADLRDALLAFDSSGRYQRTYEAEWVLGRPGA